MAFSRLRCLLKPLACALLASVATLGPAPATAASPFLMTPEASIAEASPAYRYANMTDDEALAELDRRKILYLKVDRAPGVRAPIRLTGRLNGVNFHSVLPPEQRVTSVFEILDARLALALDDFAAVLARHDIDEVVHYTMYRPNVPMPGREGADDEGEHGHAMVQAAGADSAVRKEPTKPATAQAAGVDSAVRKEPTNPATSVSLGEKGELDGTSKAPEEPPRRLKEKGAAAAAPKEKGAAAAAPKEKGAAEAAPKEKGAAEAAPKEKGAAEAAPKEKGAAEVSAKEKGAAEAAPKEKGAAEVSAKEKAAPKEKGAAEAAPKEKGAAEAAPKEKAAAPVTPGPRAPATAARSGPVNTAGKAGARRAGRRKPAGSTGATASPVKRRGDVALRTDAGQKPRGNVALRTDAGQKPRGNVALRTDAGQKPRGNAAPRADAGQKPRGTWAPPGTRHPAGLAIDVGALKKRDGTWISVARHFHGRIGDKTCGEGAPQPELPEARELRSIVCEAADLGIFTYVLTPNYNAAHADHYHMEIKPGVRWFLYH
ncbi:extensin family protein [Sorangium sp. So ce1099]|uniref:extensin family protein n=1 Tax=Sorangium sp. So ce1099 TaxID=3133331 RepID=UPI003F60752B